jgi:2',3'-cyclic-nucleotide 2'-phosphodiesterase (5'-nucleotidase family)
MKKTLICLFNIIAGLCLLASCAGERSVEIVIMHTSDIHGTFFSYDFVNDRDGLWLQMKNRISALK